MARLQDVVQNLTKNGGLVSPSVYDTAQALRFWPVGNPQAVLAWLCDQQQPDGGWNDPAVPHVRTAPTLAAVLALHEHGERYAEAVARGIAFLREHAHTWQGPLRDDISVGGELIIPMLLEQLNDYGFGLDLAPYQVLAAHGSKRRNKLRMMGSNAPQTALHSWEVWGDFASADGSLLDAIGSVAHNPAATAAWLFATAERRDLREQRQRAEQYLYATTRATGVGIPGVLPGVWPIPRFEQAFALYGIFVAGLLDHPQIADTAARQIADLASAIRPQGIGLNDHFRTDGDDTAATYAVLAAAGHFPDLDPLYYFADGDHFCAYHGELHASISVTAHALHALRMHGQDVQPLLAYLIAQQQPAGHWLSDKWNRSWIYTTSRILIATDGLLPELARQRAVSYLLRHQHADGGWGVDRSNGEETAYALLLFCMYRHSGRLDAESYHACERALAWIDAHTTLESQPLAHCWIGKELYTPYRVTQALQLAAQAAWSLSVQHESRQVGTC